MDRREFSKRMMMVGMGVGGSSLVDGKAFADPQSETHLRGTGQEAADPQV